MSEKNEEIKKSLQYESRIEKETAKYLENIQSSASSYNKKELHKSPTVIAFKLLTDGLDLKNVKYNLFISNK